ncbi:MAG: hypothetical protein IJF54_06855 [Clostridia bacterium]|nr:hypothetical protein [Clostridia bacterium]
MANSGIFRTSIFGGFNKNDVLKYFDDIKRDSAEELEQLKVTNNELMCKIDELEQQAEGMRSASEENAALKSQLEELTEKLKAADAHKSRAEQLMRAVVRTESENAALKNELQQLKAITDCLDKLDFDALQRDSKALSSLIDMLSDVKSTVKSSEN